MNLSAHITKIAQKAKTASREIALLSRQKKVAALKAIARALISQSDFIIRENQKDITAAVQAKSSSALVDRLRLDNKRIQAMAEGVLATGALKDPIGRVLEIIKRPNGLLIEKVSVPLGVVGIIFESRPNVTCDCAALCLMSGNAAILKGGREAIHSNKAIYNVIKSALQKTRVHPDAVQLIQTVDRQAVQELLKLDTLIDVIVPRGGEDLIRFVTENTRIPVVKHFKGVCHVYVSKSADLTMAKRIVTNAKTQKPGVCNAMETLLVDRAIASEFLPGMAQELFERGCALRADKTAKKIIGARAQSVTQSDWDQEYLDLILNVGVVDGIKDAIDHINTHGSHHSDAIITRDKTQATQFLNAVDSACVYVNASTRFTDGFEFGFGAEVGISTDKLHVRGPMALDGLTSYKYKIYGKGQIRQ